MVTRVLLMLNSSNMLMQKEVALNSELVWGFSLLAGDISLISLYMTNKVRMDLVALGVVIRFVLSGTLTLPEVLAGLSAA